MTAPAGHNPGGRGFPVLAAILTAIVAGAAPGGGRAAPPAPTTRPVTVAVYGDSVVEGAYLPNYLRDRLVPQLRAGLAGAGGLELGGRGFVPAAYASWHFNAKTLPVGRPPAANVWLLDGVTTPGLDGLSGYSAVAMSHQATASTSVDAASIDVLFTRTAGSGVFTVKAGPRAFAIDARTDGPPAPAERWITVPAGTRTITVHGPRAGSLTFDGVIVRGRPAAGRTRVEVENLGHSGHYLDQDSAPRTLAGLRAHRFDISIFLGAYKRELDAAGGDAGPSEAAYAAELRVRLRFVRDYGGLCLVADPSPMPVSGQVNAAFAEIDRQTAEAAGCRYTQALTHLWNPATAVATGMTIVDGVHPAAPGYRQIARALVPLVADLVAQRSGR